MQIQHRPEDQLAHPMIGPGGLTHSGAHAEIQGLLDANPQLGETAALWRHAKDDTVYAGSFIWCLYQHPDGEDPRRAALAWLEDFATTMRSAGVDVGIAHLPE